MFKLKPCPFCGSEDIHVMGVKSYWIVCRNCYAEGPVPISFWKFKKDAIEAWNKRVGDK